MPALRRSVRRGGEYLSVQRSRRKRDERTHPGRGTAACGHWPRLSPPAGSLQSLLLPPHEPALPAERDHGRGNLSSAVVPVFADDDPSQVDAYVAQLDARRPCRIRRASRTLSWRVISSIVPMTTDASTRIAWPRSPAGSWRRGHDRGPHGRPILAGEVLASVGVSTGPSDVRSTRKLTVVTRDGQQSGSLRA